MGISLLSCCLEWLEWVCVVVDVVGRVVVDDVDIVCRVAGRVEWIS